MRTMDLKHINKTQPHHQPKLILASASPRRADLLREAGFSFGIAPSSVVEAIRPGESPVDFALRMALEKALEVARKSALGGIFVLGADTIVCLGGRIYGKPKDASEARAFLSELSGKTHDVITGYAMVEGPDKIKNQGYAASHVTLARLTPEEIAAYVATGEPIDKAGAYAAQGIGRKMIEKIEGSFTNVVGLPMEDIKPLLEALPLWPS